MSTTTTTTTPKTTTLHLASGNGPITRTILPTPLRDALPSEIPIIDISPILSPSSSPSARQAVASQIRNAATNNGFFYITNHGISPSATSSAHRESLHFFKQDVSLKEPASYLTQSDNRYKIGWKPPATQRVNPFESVDHRESFSWRYHPLYDPLHSSTDKKIPPEVAKHLSELDQHGFPWGTVSPRFSEAVIAQYQAVLSLGRCLLRSFSLALGLEEDALDGKFVYPDAGLAINYYPPLPPSGKEEEEEVGIGSHTDFQLFTILWQDSVGGLEVLSTQGQWLRAKPIEGTLVLNFGDYMQRITNGKWLSTVHRVRNVTEQQPKERMSMAFFFGFGLHESCGVIETCLEEGEEVKYEEVGCAEWVERRVRMMSLK
ncbi:2OG-Fe(II) oxygenase [Podospora australis]|uniref:2OG-Fe(II) oxygenase n=1 Tax=Podospora australis TaxID=1536484 RepID=A0AAN6WLN4_9PEZI|nr:2OG-Fe(II) oxygenase [Podospora australis]